MTLLSWMVYAIAIGFMLAFAELLLEHGLARIRLPTRWVWMGSLALSVALPVAAGMGAPSTRDEVRAVSGTPAETLVTVQATGPVTAEPRGAVEALTAALAEWRAELDGILAAVATALADVRPSLSRWVAAAWGAASLLLATFLLAATVRLSRRASGWPREERLGREVGGVSFWARQGRGPATLAYALGLTMLAAVVSGVVPGLRATGKRGRSNLARLSQGNGMRLGAVWTLLIVVQVGSAVAFVPPAASLAWSVLGDAVALPTSPRRISSWPACPCRPSPTAQARGRGRARRSVNSCDGWRRNGA